MGLKIKTKVLTAFLKKARMDGTQLLNEVVLRFEDDGLKINANTSTQQARVMAWLKNSAFTEYEKLENVPMNDLSNVIKVLDSFGEEITLKKEGNLLTVSGKSNTSSKKVSIELPSEEFLASDTSEPNLEFEETFEISPSILKEIFADVKLSKDAILTITTDEKKVLFTNTGKYKFLHAVEAPSCTGGTKVSMGGPFMDVLTQLDGKLELSVKSNFPAKIREVCEHSIITIIVAPRGEEE